MITRPLDLASQLRRPPRSFDWAFYVNFGLIALFFILFGSRFVLSPALAVNRKNIRLPSVPENMASLLSSSLVVSVKANQQIFVDPTGLVTEEQLRVWFKDRAVRSPGATVLIRSDESVAFADLARISVLAREAGLEPTLAVRESPEMNGVR